MKRSRSVRGVTTTSTSPFDRFQARLLSQLMALGAVVLDSRESLARSTLLLQRWTQVHGVLLHIDGSTCMRPSSKEQRKRLRDMLSKASTADAVAWGAFGVDEPPAAALVLMGYVQPPRPQPGAALPPLEGPDLLVVPRPGGTNTHSTAASHVAVEVVREFTLAVLGAAGESLTKVLFGAKDSITALLQWSRLQRVPVFPVPRLVDPKVLAWCLDPDLDRGALVSPGLLDAYVDDVVLATAAASSTSQAAISQAMSDIRAEMWDLNVARHGQLARRMASIALLPELRTLVDVDLSALSALSISTAARLSTLHRPAWVTFLRQEMPLVPLLAEMQVLGLHVNATKLRALEHALRVRMQLAEAAAHEAAGTTFSLSSPKQVSEVLFGKLKLGRHLQRPTKSTGESVLRELEGMHPLPALILEHRGCLKQLSTYVLPLLERSQNGTRAVTCKWNQTCTGTGRLSSMHPNLQNIPRTSSVRESLHAADGCCFVSADYSQMEMRIIAHLSGDGAMLQLFAKAEGEGDGEEAAAAQEGDIYKSMASHCFGLPVDKVTDEHRQQSKIVSLGIMYGMGAQQMAAKLNQPRTSANELLRRFLARFPGVHSFLKNTRARVAKFGYVQTMAGRIRYLKHIRSGSQDRRARAERQSVNTIVQGSASDMIKCAMLKWRAVAPADEPLLLQLHDELIVSVPDDPQRRRDAAARLRAIMESVLVDARVSMKVNVSQGRTLSHLK